MNLLGKEDRAKKNVLVISHMYPNAMNLNNGIFIHQQTKAIRDYTNWEPTVISPVPYANKILSKISTKWKIYYNIPSHDEIEGIGILYPRYIVLPNKPIDRNWFLPFEPYSMGYSLKKLFVNSKKKFSLIHSHTALPDCLAASILKHVHGLPVICHFRGSDIHSYPYKNIMVMKSTEKAIKSADKIICVSEFLKRETFKIVPHYDKDIEVVYNGVDITKFHPEKRVRTFLRKKLNISPKTTVFLFVGSFQKAKGIYELLNAFSNLVKFNKNVKLLLVGDGEERKRVIENYSFLSDRLIYVGKLLHKNIPEYMNMADILVLPTYSEGLPNVILEALATGLAVISTNVGGIPEVITDGKNGILVPPQNVRELYKAMDYLSKNPDIIQTMGKLGRKHVMENFTWERSAQRLALIYESTYNNYNRQE